MPRLALLDGRFLGIVLATGLLLFSLGCASDRKPDRSSFVLSPPPSATPQVSDTVEPPVPTAESAEPTATAGPTTEATEATEATEVPGYPVPATPLNADDLAHLPDEPTDLMFATYNFSLADVGRKMAYSHNEAFIPVILEFMRFQTDDESALTLASFLVRIRDKIPEGDFSIVPYGQDKWDYWVQWLAENPDVAAPEGYDGWKGQLFSYIDQPMGEFMYFGVPTSIRLEEVVWGGVRRDGIPDLRFPPVLPPEEATYLDPQDRVFGVSINGEHRAYPLRVLNPTRWQTMSSEECNSRWHIEHSAVLESCIPPKSMARTRNSVPPGCYIAATS